MITKLFDRKTMSDLKKGISRRTFITRTTKMGLVFYGVGIFQTQPSKKTSEIGPHRYINQSKCIGCGFCVPLCPMEAISLGRDTSSIDPNECAECGACFRAKKCPTDAIIPVNLEWPRVIRETFSNPLAVHETTLVTGRGTEGIKTNDSQNRYKRGEIGVFIEVGRPVLGGRFRDVEKIVKTFKVHGYDVIPENPIAALIEDPKTGAIKPEILDEKIISCVIEFILPNDSAVVLMTMVAALSRDVESVFSLSVALRADKKGRSPFEKIFGSNIYRLPNAKSNLGVVQP